MFRNYVKAAWRNLLRDKSHTIINISGLSIGLTCSLLIFLWVTSELSVDAFFPNGGRMYAIYERQFSDNQVRGLYNTPAQLSGELKKEIPEIEYATSIDENSEKTFRVGEKALKMEGCSADSDFFKVFSYPLIEGSAETALNSPECLAISQAMAASLFGSAEAAIGKTLRYENRKDFKVTAVFENLPQIVSRRFDFVLNWFNFTDDHAWSTMWGYNGPETVILLRKSAEPAAVESKLRHFLDRLNPNQMAGVFTEELDMQRYQHVYLHGAFEGGKIAGGRIEYVQLFSLIAVFILLIACINFMNLATAKSVKRAREIGVRKVVGARRGALIVQFLTESIFITMFSILVALALAAILLPAFNQLTHKQILLPLNQPMFWLYLSLLTLVTGVVAGSYPALFLSSFNPTKVLKGTLKIGSRSVLFRKGLVVFQFALSFIFITGTIIVSKQISYIQSKNLGFDRGNLIYIPMEGSLINSYNTFKNEALSLPGVSSVSSVSDKPSNIQGLAGIVNWPEKDPNANIQFAHIGVGYDFVHTMHLQLVSGRDFSSNYSTDTLGFLINEAALSRMGYKNPIGRPLGVIDKKGTIIGVIRDFHFQSMHEEIKPLVISLDPMQKSGLALIRTQAGNTAEALRGLEGIYNKINPGFPFSYSFADEEYLKLYISEQIVGRLSLIFAFLAIFISCLGLLGLSMFLMEQRLKEIGIRKVLGAGLGTLLVLLSLDFLRLVVLAFVVAVPVSWYFMHLWLESFAYRSTIPWWVFALGGGLMLMTTFATVSVQAMKAALINPVKALKNE
jgi:putative ABC transport system permease protein